MYTHSEEHDVEEVCYEPKHISSILSVINKNFDKWFDKFLEAKGGKGVTGDKFNELKKKFKVSAGNNKSQRDSRCENYKHIIASSIDNFESDREAYLDIFDPEILEEYEDDVSTFKSKVLRDKCPIIRKTIQNRRAKKLDKYRSEFNLSDAHELLRVVTNLCEFEENYETNAYDFQSNVTLETLGMEPLDTDDYTVYGVIGGGIKSHMLFKVKPQFFPNRSQFAMWSLWFLTDKNDFGCKTNSEFLMIDADKCITQQNYFYPYSLFSYYAYEIYHLIKTKADKLGAYIDENYRYVLVDSFLSFIAEQHSDDINLLISQIREGDCYDA